MPTDFGHHLVGRQVVYTAHHPGAKPEQGMVTSVNVDAFIVFVNYGRGSTSQATDPGDLKTLSGERVTDLIERGTGRTTRQLLEAPEEFWFVVHTTGSLEYTKRLQQEHAPDKKVLLIQGVDVYDRLRGTTLPILVDHAAWETLDDTTAGFIRQHNDSVGYSRLP